MPTTLSGQPQRALAAARRTQLPPRLLPVLYFGAAHVALAVAFAVVAVDPRGVSGFFYHPRLLGVVHLVTLGWITASILGALYVVGPIALRVWIPATRLDYIAWALVFIGITGMVAHFWIQDYSGMAWSAGTVGAGILMVGARVVPCLGAAALPRAVSAHIVLAFVNVVGATTMGVLLGFDKVYHFLPGYVLANVVAHAHFAVIGWASMMVVGIGYRLLPMVLPAEMPRGRTLYASAILLEAGAIGLFITLMLRSRWVAVFAAVTVAGLVAFIAHAAAMLKRRRPRPPDLPAVDYAGRHAGLALGSLAVAAALGMVLALSEPSDLTMRMALAYGVFGLVGFLAQMVAGMQLRLLPLLAWYSAAHRAAAPESLPSMSVLSATPLAGAAWLLWLWGVPALATGFFAGVIPLLAGGALALEAAVAIGAIQAIRLACHAFGRAGRLSCGHRDADPRRGAAQQPAVPTAQR